MQHAGFQRRREIAGSGAASGWISLPSRRNEALTKKKKKKVSTTAQDTLLSEIISILSVKTESMSSQHFRVIGNVTWLWRENTRRLFYSTSDYFSGLQKPEKMHQRQQSSLQELLNWLTARAAGSWQHVYNNQFNSLKRDFHECLNAYLHVSIITVILVGTLCRPAQFTTLLYKKKKNQHFRETR